MKLFLPFVIAALLVIGACQPVSQQAAPTEPKADRVAEPFNQDDPEGRELVVPGLVPMGGRSDDSEGAEPESVEEDEAAD
jgi:hypothetical protein